MTLLNQSIPYQRLTSLQIQSKTDWVFDEIVFNTTIEKYVQYDSFLGRAVMIKGQVSEHTISEDYTLDDNYNFIIVNNLTSDTIITVPNSNARYSSLFWKILRDCSSAYKVYISLENPTNSIFGEQFHTMLLENKGDGIEIYNRKLDNKYSYAEYSGRLLVASMPIIITVGADLNGTSLNLFGNIDSLGFNASVDVYFRYREEGTSTWTETTPQSKTVTGAYSDTATVTAGVKYEVQAVLKDSKDILFYGDIKLSSSWIDLRTGGELLSAGNGAGNDIRYRSGMNIVRDAEGMYFTGSNPWSSWVKFEKYAWSRGENKTIQWILSRPSSSMMIGIGSDATNETSSSQYSQAEVEAYFSNSNTLYGLYGNNGIVGNAASQSHNVNISGGSGIFKIKFTNDGAGNSGTFSIYELPSANPSDWNDESNLLDSFTIDAGLAADELNIMPFIIPRDGGTQRFIALKIL